jgi:hypothetical protein
LLWQKQTRAAGGGPHADAVTVSQKSQDKGIDYWCGAMTRCGLDMFCKMFQTSNCLAFFIVITELIVSII